MKIPVTKKTYVLLMKKCKWAMKIKKIQKSAKKFQTHLTMLDSKSLWVRKRKRRKVSHLYTKEVPATTLKNHIKRICQIQSEIALGSKTLMITSLYYRRKMKKFYNEENKKSLWIKDFKINKWNYSSKCNKAARVHLSKIFKWVMRNKKTLIWLSRTYLNRLK